MIPQFKEPVPEVTERFCASTKLSHFVLEDTNGCYLLVVGILNYALNLVVDPFSIRKDPTVVGLKGTIKNVLSLVNIEKGVELFINVVFDKSGMDCGVTDNIRLLRLRETNSGVCMFGVVTSYSMWMLTSCQRGLAAVSPPIEIGSFRAEDPSKVSYLFSMLCSLIELAMRAAHPIPKEEKQHDNYSLLVAETATHHTISMPKLDPKEKDALATQKKQVPVFSEESLFALLKGTN